MKFKVKKTTVVEEEMDLDFPLYFKITGSTGIEDYTFYTKLLSTSEKFTIEEMNHDNGCDKTYTLKKEFWSGDFLKANQGYIENSSYWCTKEEFNEVLNKVTCLIKEEL